MIRAAAPALLLAACATGVVTPHPLESGPDERPAAEDAAAEFIAPGDAPDEQIEDAEPPDDNVLFNNDILEVELKLSEASLQSLAADPFTYVEASLSVAGQTLSPVGVRLKGENSYLPIDQKPSLKLKLDWANPNLRLLGLRELTLNNLSNDPSMIHERVAYRVYREAGVPAPRCGHAWLRINGEDYGLYAHVETVNRQLISRWFNDDSGSLFEVWDVDFYDRYVDAFELESGDDDRSLIQATADAMEEDAPRAVAEVQAALNLRQFLRYWAVSAVVGQFDAYPYTWPGDDAHVYADPETARLHFLPHGMDETFSFPSSDVTHVNGVLAATCLEVSSCEADFAGEVMDILSLVEHIDLLGHATFVRDQVAPLVAADSHRPYDADDVDEAQDLMLSFIEQREATLTEQLSAAAARRSAAPE